jgi:hypothetical protein
MRTFKSSALLVVAAVAALVGSSLPVLGLPSAVVQAASPVPLSAGTMTLTVAEKKGTVEWDGLQQEFSSGGLGQCQMKDTAGTADLIDFRGYIGTMSSSAGFKNGKIGVYEFSKPDGPPVNASHCDLVDTKKDNGKKKLPPRESLGLQLGTDAADTFGPVYMTKASLSLFTHTKTGEIRVSLLDAEGNVIETSTVTWNAPSGGSNPLPQEFTGEFSGIMLTALKGDFSLRGGSFDLATLADDVFCVDGSDNTFTNDAGVTVTFIGNADGSPCEGFGIRLTGDEISQVHFIKPLDVDPEAQFIFEIPWNTVGWPASKLGSELPQAFIDFEDTVPPTEYEMPYCPDSLFNDEGQLVGLDGSNPADLAALPDMVDDISGDLRTEGTQFACIGDRDATVEKSTDGPGYDVDITDLIYLIGDARMSLK